MIKNGICPLHCKIRGMEYLFGVGVKLKARKDNRDVLDLVKIKDAKHSIQKEFVDRIGIRIDFVKQGKGTSTNGNAASRLFENCEISAEILDIDKNIIQSFSKQLNKINSVTTCYDPDTYKEDSKELFEKIVQQLGHVGNMSPTVHRVLVHGHEFLQWAKEIGIPLGRFSESAIEYRNKDRRKARLKFSRKNSRENNTTDMYHYLIKTSDPIVNSI